MLHILSRARDFKEIINMGGIANTTQLMIAADSANLDMIKFLLSNGANIKDKANDGLNVTMFATMSRAKPQKVIEVIEFLLANGVPSVLQKLARERYETKR